MMRAGTKRRSRKMIREKLELGDLLQKFEVYKRSEDLSERTVEWYQQALGLFQAWLADQKMSTCLDDLGEDEVRLFILHLKDRSGLRGPASSHTVNNRVRALRAFFHWLFEKDYTDCHRLEKVRPPKPRELAMGWSTAILTRLNGNGSPSWNRLLRRRRSAEPERQSQFATSCAGRPWRNSRLAGRRSNRLGSKGFPSRAIARNLGMAKNTAKKYASAESPPTKKLSPRSEPRRRPGQSHQPPPTKPGDIFVFQLGGHNRWTTTNSQ